MDVYLVLPKQLGVNAIPIFVLKTVTTKRALKCDDLCPVSRIEEDVPMVKLVNLLLPRYCDKVDDLVMNLRPLCTKFDSINSIHLPMASSILKYTLNSVTSTSSMLFLLIYLENLGKWMFSV
jgi:hypothetical protein